MTTISAAVLAAGDGGDRALRRLSVAVAVAVWMLLLVAVALEVARSGRQAIAALVSGFSLYGLLALLAYGALGTALTWARPRNALGWVALGIATVHGLTAATAAYGLLALERGWPGAAAAVWMGSWMWVAGYWTVPTFLLLLFPDGRLPSRRWRPVAGVALAGLVVSMVGWATLPYAQRDLPLPLDLPQPITLPFAGALMALGGVLGVVAALAGIAALLVRHARASGAERLQVRWVLLGGVATVLLLGAAVAAGTGAGPVLVAIGMVPLPAAIAIGVLRHRLWNVDVVINRSLVYGVLTLAVLATYVGTVSALGGLLGRGTGAPLVATALVAIGVNPVRQRLQTWVNEAVHGERDDPSTALARLVERLDAIDGARNALDEAAGTVRRVVRGAYVAVEVRGELRSVSGVPPSKPGGLHLVPLTVRGEPVGTLQVAAAARADRLEAGEQRLLQDLARHIALAVHTEQLTADLQASRRSLVEARETERQRIRRDLHDDLGPTLAAVAMRIEQARDSPRSAGAAALDGLPEQVRDAVRSVRRLVEELRPAALDELGLPAALRAQARQFSGGGLRVEAEIDDDLGALSAAADAAAYRIVSEALANAMRHANASTCRVSVRREGDTLHLEVVDDGVGLPSVLRAGVGLRSMRERAGEVGGTCVIESMPSTGTAVRVVLPVGD